MTESFANQWARVLRNEDDADQIIYEMTGEPTLTMMRHLLTLITRGFTQ